MDVAFPFLACCGVGSFQDLTLRTAKSVLSARFSDVESCYRFHFQRPRKFQVSSNAWVIDKLENDQGTVSILQLGECEESCMSHAKVLCINGIELAQSVWWPHKIWTKSYYDDFATFPPLLPPGPVAILGLGGGTGARILRHTWPDLQIHGWEVNPAVVELARKHFGFEELEITGAGKLKRKISEKRTTGLRRKNNKQSSGYQCPIPAENEGSVTVHLESAFRLSMLGVQFSGIIVDLADSEGTLNELERKSVWKDIKSCLHPQGRVFVNCLDKEFHRSSPQNNWDGSITQLMQSSTKKVILRLAQVFGLDLCLKEMRNSGGNVLLMTGPLPEADWWESEVPIEVRCNLKSWIQLAYDDLLLEDCL